MISWNSADPGQLVEGLADELDVAPSRYEEAKQHYEAVGRWLNEDESEIGMYSPDIFPQGSFALGTAVKPTGALHYDVDAVCLLYASRDDLTQQELKRKVGARLAQHERYAKMLAPPEGGRRCWTLVYSESSAFHLDVLPAIPDKESDLVSAGVAPEYAAHAIQITDQLGWLSSAGTHWPKSNPQGYVLWFKNQMRVRLEELRKSKAIEKKAQLFQIQDFEVRTPLQRAIQLLKRHRDDLLGNDQDKPISIIITTLAARAYSGEPDVMSTLLAILPAMASGVEFRNGIPWVPNPVNPAENFADRWQQEPRKLEKFQKWTFAVKTLYEHLRRASTVDEAQELLAKSYNAGFVKEAVRKRFEHPVYKTASGGVASVVDKGQLAATAPRFEVAHRERLEIPAVSEVRRVAMRGWWQRTNGEWKEFASEEPIPRKTPLRFSVVPHAQLEDCLTIWQVANTGMDARRAGQLRGRLIRDYQPAPARFSREERTSYRGVHWVECFLTRDGVCVARTYEFVVRIV